MALNIKNPEVERLATEIAQVTGESKTEAIRRALAERSASFRITEQSRSQRIRRFLEREVWSRIPDDQIGQPPDRSERERILGYSEEGV